MKVKNTLLTIIPFLIPFCFVHAQNVDTTMAILEDRQRTQQIMNYLHAQGKEQDRTLVIYKEKFYSLSDFDLVEKVTGSNAKLKIVNHPDSIARELYNRIQHVIILDEKQN